MLEPDDDDCVPLPYLQRWDNPDWAVRFDIEQSDAYPNFATEFEQFVNDVSSYQDTWEELRDSMAETLLNEFESELETITDDRGNSPQKEAEQYAKHALRCSEQYLEPSELNEQLNERATDLRNNVFTEEISNLESQAADIRTQNKEIGKGLEQVRKEYKETYEIAEHEIKEVRETSELDDGLSSYTPAPTYTDEDVF